MNENIDLTEILKDCPEGTILWSKIHGEVKFQGIKNSILPISTICYTNDKREYNADFTKEGSISIYIKGECLLVPSKNQQDWSKFTAPWYKKEKLVELKESKDKKIRESILNGLIDCRDAPDLGWSNFGGIRIDDCITWLKKQGEQNLPYANKRTWLYLVSDVLTWKDGIGQYLDDPRVQEIAKRLCDKYAQKLYNPSVLSNSSNTRKDKQRFDPKTFKPFDKVLARIVSSDIWICDFFSHMHPNKEHCISVSSWSYNEMIPYNDDTKHLVGTSEKAPEYYRYWEDLNYDTRK